MLFWSGYISIFFGRCRNILSGKDGSATPSRKIDPHGYVHDSLNMRDAWDR